MIKERLEKEKEEKPPKKPGKDTVKKEVKEPEKIKGKRLEDMTVDELASRINEIKRPPFVKSEYQGRETISASIPGWIKAAVDYIATKEIQYSGFGGKSKFIAEALLGKIERDYPEIYKKLAK
ncbi:MAG: hypothetical protein ACTSVM_05085 [Candidatus Ranarchaeia archaeon]